MLGFVKSIIRFSSSRPLRGFNGIQTLPAAKVASQPSSAQNYYMHRYQHGFAVLGQLPEAPTQGRSPGWLNHDN